MLKIVFIVFVIVSTLLEFWFLTDLNKDTKVDPSNINIKKLPPLEDYNSSSIVFFDTQLWRLTKADYVDIEKVDTNLSDKFKNQEDNNTIKLITQKGTKQLCRGKKCMTIKAIMSNTLLLGDEDKVISLKPTEIIFDVIKFVKLTDTELFFENNETGEEYELKFFSYAQKRDNNETKQEKEGL